MQNLKKWKDISYLANGNDKQRLCYIAICKLDILTVLAQYEPIVVGTIPIEIDIPDSDLDIIYNIPDPIKAREFIRKQFSKFNSFKDKITPNHYVASFVFNDIEIELYGENMATTMQNAYRHMVIEARLLNIMTDDFREKVIDLKLNGYKTEPAFGTLLGLDNAYLELLLLENYSDSKLATFALHKGYKIK